MRPASAFFFLCALTISSLGCAREEPAESAATTEIKEVKEPTRYYRAALQAATWIDSQARELPAGLSWGEPVEISEELPADFDPRLLPFGAEPYHGDAGTIRFWLEAYRHTGDRSYLERAEKGGDAILARLPEKAPENPAYRQFYGLHSGWGGVLWTLEQIHQAQRHDADDAASSRFRDGATALLDQIHQAATDDGQGGVHWGEVNELFYGNAGYGLLLLWAAETFDHEASKELAIRAGRWLLGTSKPREGGVTWPWGASDPALVMPNFSHGTAGVAYFLAQLYEETGDEAFLEAALAGTGHLTTVAQTGEGQYCLVFHHEDTEQRQGEDRYYLGFCHGPVGTSRLFERLYRATGEEHWRQWVERGTRAIAESGIPEKETPGFWNNVSQCCGSAGVIEHFVHRYRLTGENAYLDFARRMGDDLLERGTEENGGLKWLQAEHRVKPDLLEAQIGFMQGAAGIGTALLHLDAAIRGLEIEPLYFVDDPWQKERH